MAQKIVPNILFDTRAEEAAEFYCSVFEDARILSKTHYPEDAPREAGTVMTVEFELCGMRFLGINGGGPGFAFNESVSFAITCADQAELDRYWEKLIADGGAEGQCGWLTDRFGLSWQVVPEGAEELFADSDPERAHRAMQAMLKMRKLDIEALRKAADGVAA